jgi:SAM-dependent methyltransferase
MNDRQMRTMLDVDEHHWWFRGRRAVIAAELDSLRLPRPARSLDAGCGSGRTLLMLAPYGPVSGVELNEEAAAVARGRGDFDVRDGRLEELPFDDESFDLITCLDVIEHTPDDVVTLRELHRVAAPEAWLLVTVPAYQSLWSRHDVTNHHYRRYGRASLRAAAVAAGWRVDRLTSFNSLLLAPAAAVRLADRFRPANGDYTPDLELGPEWLNGVLELPLRAEARWLATGRTLPVGMSLMALMQRPAG